MADSEDAAHHVAPVRIEIESGAAGSADAPLLPAGGPNQRGTQMVVGLGVLVGLLSLAALFGLRPDPNETADGSPRTSTTVPSSSSSTTTRVPASSTIDPDGSNRIAAEQTRGLINAQSVVETDIGYLVLEFATTGLPGLRRSVDGILWQSVSTSLGPEALALLERGRIDNHEALIADDDGFALLATFHSHDASEEDPGSLIRMRSDSGELWELDPEFPIRPSSALALGVSAHTASTVARIEADGFTDLGFLTFLNSELLPSKQVSNGCTADRPNPTELIVFPCVGREVTIVGTEDLTDPARSGDVFGCTIQLAAVTTPIGDTTLTLTTNGEELPPKTGPKHAGRSPGLPVGESFAILEAGNRLEGVDLSPCDGIAEVPPQLESSILVWEGTTATPRRLVVPEEPTPRGSALLPSPQQDTILFVGVDWLWSLDLQTDVFTRFLELPESDRQSTETYITTDRSRLVHIDQARIFVAELGGLSNAEDIYWSKSQLFPRNAVRFVILANARQLIALTDIGYVSIRLPEILPDAELGAGDAEPSFLGDAKISALNTRVALRSITAAGGGYLALGAAPDIEGLLTPNILVSAAGVDWVGIPTGLGGVELVEGADDERVTRSFDALTALENQLVVSMVEVVTNRASGQTIRSVTTRLASVDGRSWTADTEFAPFEVDGRDTEPIGNTFDTSAVSLTDEEVGHPLIELLISSEVIDPDITRRCWSGAVEPIGSGRSDIVALVACGSGETELVSVPQLASPELATDLVRCLVHLDGQGGQPTEILARRRGEPDIFQYSDVGATGSKATVTPTGQIVLLDPGRSLPPFPACDSFNTGSSEEPAGIGIVSIEPGAEPQRLAVSSELVGRRLFTLPTQLIATDDAVFVPAGNEVYAADRASGQWSRAIVSPQSYQQIWVSPDGQRLFAFDGSALFIAMPGGQWQVVDLGTPLVAESLLFADSKRAFFGTRNGQVVIEFPAQE